MRGDWLSFARIGLPAVLLLICAGCGTSAWGTYDGTKLIQTEFGKLNSENVTPVHCEVVLTDGKYPSAFSRWLGGSVPYRLEVLAPPSWIAAVAKKNSLELVTRDRAGRQRADLSPSRGHRPPWFVPGDLDDYDIYGLFLTSYPYQVMWVHQTPEPDGRVRAFITVK